MLLAYESRSGRSRRAAEVVAEAVRTGSSDAVLKALAETTAEDVEHADGLAVGSWVEGLIVVKVGPAKAALGAIGRHVLHLRHGVNPRGTLAILRRSLEEKGQTSWPRARVRRPGRCLDRPRLEHSMLETRRNDRQPCHRLPTRGSLRTWRAHLVSLAREGRDAYDGNDSSSL